MGRRRASVAGSGDGPEFTEALLTLLGLPPDASRDDIEAAHDGLVAFLESAPPPLRSWARAQTTSAQAAYVLLADGEPEGTSNRPGDEAAGKRAASSPGDEFDEDDRDEFDEDDRDEFDEEPDKDTAEEPDEDTAGKTARSRPGGGRRARRTPPERSRGARRSRLVPVALILIVGAVVYGVQQSGGGGVPEVSAKATVAPTSSTQPLDKAKVADLMGKLSTNPKDVSVLRALGDLYFQSGDYKAAAGWQQKIVDIDPKDITARLALGAAQFNVGDTTNAEREWLKVVALDPKQAEAHYDLGFLYLSKNPPDMAKVKSEWNTVVQIDPNSDIAKTVSTHLQSLNTTSSMPSSSPSSTTSSTSSSSPAPAGTGK